jgi:hypothetical protein
VSGLDDLAAEPVEDMTAGALAAHYETLAAHLHRLDDLAEGTDPTTYTDQRLREATSTLLVAVNELAERLSDKLLAAGHISEGARA